MPKSKLTDKIKIKQLKTNKKMELTQLQSDNQKHLLNMAFEETKENYNMAMCELKGQRKAQLAQFYAKKHEEMKRYNEQKSIFQAKHNELYIDWKRNGSNDTLEKLNNIELAQTKAKETFATLLCNLEAENAQLELEYQNNVSALLRQHQQARADFRSKIESIDKLTIKNA